MPTDDHAALTRAFDHARAWLEGLDTAPVAAPASLDELRHALGRPLTAGGVPAARVIDDLVADATPGINASQGGRFFGWVIGGGTPAAMGADWLTTVWDQNACLHASGPAAAVVEEVAGGWLKDLFDLPDEASFGLVTGYQMAHLTCLAAARDALLRDRRWDVERQGLFGAPRIRVLVNAERHGTVDIALRLLGFGTDTIELLPMDADRRVSPEGLRAALSASDAPAIVVLQAGELNLAAFDPFAELAAIARAAGAWTHVDGAFGLWAKVAPQRRHLADGIEQADSWTTDGHKYLNVPYDSGLAFVRDAAAHRAAMSYANTYLPVGDGLARDPINWNPEFSRRARGFTVYAALRELGRDGLAELVERTCRHAKALAEGIGGLENAQLLSASGLNQALVRFLDPDSAASPADHDRRTDAIIAAVNRSGEALFGGVTWQGMRCMRISVSNWRTTEADVARTIAAVADALNS